MIVIESQLEQWLGNETEYQQDFGQPYNPSYSPTHAEVAAACRKREARNNPPPTPEQVKAVQNGNIQVQIDLLEKNTLSALRAGLLSLLPPSPALAALANADNEITAERAKLQV